MSERSATGSGTAWEAFLGQLDETLAEAGLDVATEIRDGVLYLSGELDSVENRNAALDVWGDPLTIAETLRRFGYAFRSPRTNDGIWYAPSLVAREIIGPFRIGALAIVPFAQTHGGDRDPTLGLRFGRFAYSTDVKELTEDAFRALAGVEVWAVDCLQESPNPAHSHLEQTLDWIGRVKPRRAVLTHMNHRVDYAAWAARLPVGVEPGYDGMVIEI